MTARPPFDDDALSPEERALAARLAADDAGGGPSAALDARILAAARAAAAPGGTSATAGPGIPSRSAGMPRATRRRRTRWPTAVGAAATLVVAVGLAWQLRPLLDLPPPLRRPVESAPVEAEVLAQAEPVSPTAAPPPPAAAASEAATDSAAPAARKAAARAAAPSAPLATRSAGAQASPVVERAAPAAPASTDYLDEAIGDAADGAAAPAAAAVAAPAPPAPPGRDAGAALQLAEEAVAHGEAARLERVEVTGSRVGDAAAPAGTDTITVTGGRVFPPVAADASLGPVDWLERIRLRRDAGDVDAARASLRLFRREYPRHRLPEDLRALLAEPR